MTLRTKLFLTTTCAILAFFFFAEIASHRQAAAFLAHHEAQILAQEGAVKSALLEEKRALLTELALLRLASVAGAVLSLFVILGWLWRRMVFEPLRKLRVRMDQLSRGTWKGSVPLECRDEIGDIVEAFNRLGPQLTFTAHQFAVASKLAAMALLGHRLVRRVAVARQQTLAIAGMLRVSGSDNAAAHLESVAEDLGSLRQEFETEFERQFEQHSSLALIPPDAESHASPYGRLASCG